MTVISFGDEPRLETQFIWFYQEGKGKNRTSSRYANARKWREIILV